MRRAALSEREMSALNSLTQEGDFRAKAMAIAFDMNDTLSVHPYHVHVVYGARSKRTQWQLWEKGRKQNAAGEWEIVDLTRVVTFAKPEESAHCYAAAVDIAIRHDKDDPLTKGDDTNTWIHVDSPQWDRLAEWARSAGLVTGSDFKRIRDRAHIELANWKDLAKSGVLRLED